MVAAVLLAGLAGAGAVVSVRAGDGRGPWEGLRRGTLDEGRGRWEDGPRHGRWSALSPEDRAAFADARIAALHAGLKLNTDQEKLWPPVETALHDLDRQREAHARDRRERGAAEIDPPAALRSMADAATARGEVLRKLADASGPLYATLDEGQKRRARILARPMGSGLSHGGWHHRMQDGRARQSRASVLARLDPGGRRGHKRGPSPSGRVAGSPSKVWPDARS